MMSRSLESLRVQFDSKMKRYVEIISSIQSLCSPASAELVMSVITLDLNTQLLSRVAGPLHCRL